MGQYSVPVPCWAQCLFSISCTSVSLSTTSPWGMNNAKLWSTCQLSLHRWEHKPLKPTFQLWITVWSINLHKGSYQINPLRPHLEICSDIGCRSYQNLMVFQGQCFYAFPRFPLLTQLQPVFSLTREWVEGSEEEWRCFHCVFLRPLHDCTYCCRPGRVKRKRALSWRAALRFHQSPLAAW